MEHELLHQILSELQSIKTDVTSLKVGQHKLEAGQHKLEAEIMAIKSEITDIKSEITTLKSQQDETLQIAKAIHHRQEISDSKLEALTMSTHHLHGSLTGLKEGQERQDRILESLSMRSLEQETELREIKRIK